MADLSLFASYRGSRCAARTASKTRRRIRWLSPGWKPGAQWKNSTTLTGQNPVTSQSGKQSRLGWVEGLCN